jgi:hypothetical protein
MRRDPVCFLAVSQEINHRTIELKRQKEKPVAVAPSAHHLMTANA